jgi:hypothetical protein
MCKGKSQHNKALVLTRAPFNGARELPAQRAEGSDEHPLERISLTRNEPKGQGDTEPGREAA